jgi:calcineurin-like phosphoesterase family protein
MKKSVEFKQDMYWFFYDQDLIEGRIISGSKSGYRTEFPDHVVIFNANIVIRSKGKIWYGDLDLTLEEDKLKSISEKFGEPLYILYEMDGRFEHENDSPEQLIKKAVVIIGKDY